MMGRGGPMGIMEPGSIVVVDCLDPNEKVWGVLLRLDAIGVVVRGLGLGSVNDWLGQEVHGVEAYVAPSTVFVPLHRVARVYMDETSATADGYADRYAKATGGDVREALGATALLAELAEE